jgi:hypothetical protein
VDQLHVCRLRGRTPWAPTTDELLRVQVLASLSSHRGFRMGWIGRNDPTVGNERVVASVWDGMSIPPITKVLSDTIGLNPGRVGFVQMRSVGVTIQAVFPRPDDATILRLFQGRVHPGLLDPYLDEARRGNIVDGADPMGPIAVVSGTDEPDSFMTISTWSSWSCVEACTGGDMQRP